MVENNQHIAIVLNCGERISIERVYQSFNRKLCQVAKTIIKDEEVAKEALRLGAHKLPVQSKFVRKGEESI